MRGETWSDTSDRAGEAVSDVCSSRRARHELRIRGSELRSGAQLGRFRATYERELRKSLAAICGSDDVDGERLDDAIALMTVCVGGMSLARAVADPKFSARILRVARVAAAKLAAKQSN